MENNIAGPWIAVPSTERMNSGAYKPIFPDGLWHIIRRNNPELLPIATVDRADDHDDPTRADAKPVAMLIAAAPDLLAALREMTPVFNTARLIMNSKEARDLAGEFVERARAAIAKAEGR